MVGRGGYLPSLQHRAFLSAWLGNFDTVNFADGLLDLLLGLDSRLICAAVVAAVVLVVTKMSISTPKLWHTRKPLFTPSS